MVLLLCLTACTRPGLRGEGRGEARWDDRPAVDWTGSCTYEVQTLWSTTLPHVLRLAADDSDWSIVISGPGRFPEGRNELSPVGEGRIQGLVLDGGMGQGSVFGSIDVSRRADTTTVDIVGMKAYRDTVPLEATCRLGPVSGS